MVLDPEKYDFGFALLAEEEGFDESYYIEENPDVINAGITPFEHYLNYGWKEGRDPSREFSTENYLSENPDVVSEDMNPLYHYIVWGRTEGRNISIKRVNTELNDEFYRKLQRSHKDGDKSSDYSPRIESHALTNQDAPKVIAFYLPQFHPFKENDAWWGKGFTEWSNVAKAIPQFKDHYQPRLPSDLGYYDLRLTDVMAEQINMANLHGIEAFCFHYYWFAGHRLMEKPLEAYLENDEKLNFPFCLCWANENWTRRWDGSENDILMAQEHSEADNEAVFYDLLRYFKDKRYITVNGKPLIVIYRPDIITDLQELTKQWRALAVKEGLPGLHLVSTNAFGFKDYQGIGFDAIVEFPPHGIEAGNINSKIELYNNDYTGNVYDYDEVIDFSLQRLESQAESEYAKGYYPTVMTAWDNSARKPGNGNVFHGATPAKFQRWIDGCYRWSNDEHHNGEKFVFVNAWNEWAEGTYLEPDKKYGYAYLNAVRSTINENSKKERGLLNLTQKVKGRKSSDTIALIHIFYEDLIDEISECITTACKFKKIDVAISIPDSFSIEATKKIIKKLKPVRIVLVENRGRDIWPFLQTLDVILNLNYKFGLKLHSKKSTHLLEGNKWRKSIYNGLLSSTSIKSAFNCFEMDESIGLVAPKDFMFALTGDALIDNCNSLNVLTALYDCETNEKLPFVAGSMFWFSFEMATHLLHEGVNRELFGPELGAVDGTIAHAYERFIVSLAEHNHFKLENYEIDNYYNPY